MPLACRSGDHGAEDRMRMLARRSGDRLSQAVIMRASPDSIAPSNPPRRPQSRPRTACRIAVCPVESTKSGPWRNGRRRGLKTDRQGAGLPRIDKCLLFNHLRDRTKRTGNPLLETRIASGPPMDRWSCVFDFTVSRRMTPSTWCGPSIGEAKRRTTTATRTVSWRGVRSEFVGGL